MDGATISAFNASQGYPTLLAELQTTVESLGDFAFTPEDPFDPLT